MAVTLGIAILVMKLWRADFSVPLRPGADATVALVVAKAMIAHGWYLNIPELGAPFGVSLSDFPATAGDGISLLLFRFFALFTSNPAVVVNLYFVAGFPLVALSAFLVLRRLGVSRPTSTVISSLYALLPPHFLRGELHLFLGAYISAPIGCYLILRTLGDEPIFIRAGVAGERPTWRSRRNLVPLALCVLVGALGTDYAVFTIVLLIVCAVIGAGVRGSARSLISPLILSAAIAATLAVQYLPTLVYHVNHGANTQVGKRYPYESDLYGLRIADLVLPQPQDRIPLLATLGKSYAQTDTHLTSPQEDTFDTLGVIGALGFVDLLVVGLAAIVKRRSLSSTPPLEDRAAFATFVAVLAGVSGGFPILFATFVTPDVRAWNRIAVFIGFFAMLAVALVLDGFRSRLHGTRHRRVAVCGMLGAVLLFGAFEQTNDGPLFVPPYKQNAVSDRSTQALVAAMEQQLPHDASIWQLPYEPFPESPPHGAEQPYDQLVPYLHSAGLHWSGGAIKGRGIDWQAQLTNVPLSTLLPGVTAAGFDGVLVDRLAYRDSGASVVAQLTRLVGPASLTSANGRYAFFNLRPYARSLRTRVAPARLAALARATVTPIQLAFGDGFGSPGQLSARVISYPAIDGAQLEITNPGRTPVSAVLTGALASGQTPAASVTVSVPHGRTQTVPLTRRGSFLRIRLTLAPGSVRIAFTTRPAEPAAPTSSSTFSFRLNNPELTQGGLGLP